MGLLRRRQILEPTEFPKGPNPRTENRIVRSDVELVGDRELRVEMFPGLVPADIEGFSAAALDLRPMTPEAADGYKIMSAGCTQKSGYPPFVPPAPIYTSGDRLGAPPHGGGVCHLQL